MKNYEHFCPHLQLRLRTPTANERFCNQCDKCPLYVDYDDELVKQSGQVSLDGYLGRVREDAGKMAQLRFELDKDTAGRANSGSSGSRAKGSSSSSSGGVVRRGRTTGAAPAGYDIEVQGVRFQVVL